MKSRIYAIGIAVVLACIVAGCDKSVVVSELNIIPEPVFEVQKEASFSLNRTPKLSVVGLGQNSSTMRYIIQSMRHAHFHPRMVATSENSDIELMLYDTVNPELGNEGYLLEVQSGGIRLMANTEQGLFYAFQTLLQMLPSEVMSVNYSTIVLPECTILDRPRFASRGVQMDMSHMPFSFKEMKRWVELLAYYKMNRLYITMNSVDETIGEEDMREFVEFAKTRGVMVVPELCDGGPSDSLYALCSVDASELPVLCYTPKGALDSARAGWKVLMSPNDYFDLSKYQADPRYQPNSATGITTLNRVYSFNPAPVGTNQHVVANVWGGLCRLSTELIGSERDAEYMLLPRMLAVSECLWSPNERKEWVHFRRKVEEHKDRLAERGFTYCEGSFTPQFNVHRVDDNIVNVSISTEVPNTYIFYTLDTTPPTRQSSIYLGPINLERGTHIKILSVYKDQERDSIYEFVIK